MNFSKELNELFERLVKKKEEGLKEVESLKEDLLRRIDSKIEELYKKRNFISEVFEKRQSLSKYRISVWKKFVKGGVLKNIPFIISMPFIYGMIIPAIFMHIILEAYHQICFRLYRIPRVNPKNYFIFDRRLLPYLNWFEKFNCAYCSYFNGLVAYLQEIAGRTERFWCPIKHSKMVKNPHSEYERFIDYSDAKSLRREWKRLRKF